MVAALESAWAAVRARHPEIPAVVIVVGAGSGQRPGTLKLHHFAALRWITNPTDYINHRRDDRRVGDGRGDSRE